MHGTVMSHGIQKHILNRTARNTSFGDEKRWI
jgi:hypothetical protein